MTTNDEALHEQAREQSAGINARLAAGESLYPYVDVPDEFVDAGDELVYADEVADELDPADAAMLLARLADPSPGIPLDELIAELGFDRAEFVDVSAEEEPDLSGLVAHRPGPAKPARIWLLWDSDDLIAAFSSEASALAARKAHSAAVRAELAKETGARPVRIHVEVTPIDVQD